MPQHSLDMTFHNIFAGFPSFDLFVFLIFRMHITLVRLPQMTEGFRSLPCNVIELSVVKRDLLSARREQVCGSRERLCLLHVPETCCLVRVPRTRLRAPRTHVGVPIHTGRIRKMEPKRVKGPTGAKRAKRVRVNNKNLK